MTPKETINYDLKSDRHYVRVDIPINDKLAGIDIGIDSNDVEYLKSMARQNNVSFRSMIGVILRDKVEQHKMENKKYEYK